MRFVALVKKSGEVFFRGSVSLTEEDNVFEMLDGLLDTAKLTITPDDWDNPDDFLRRYECAFVEIQNGMLFYRPAAPSWWNDELKAQVVRSYQIWLECMVVCKRHWGGLVWDNLKKAVVKIVSIIKRR